MMPMETMVETMPSMESVVLVESMPSAMTVSSPVSTSGPDIIDNTRPAQQSEHRE